MPVKQQVFWLQIPVDDLFCVEVFQCEGNLGSIEFCYRVRESLSYGLVKLKLIAPEALPAIFVIEKIAPLLLQSPSPCTSF
jgi:hypothetical protein